MVLKNCGGMQKCRLIKALNFLSAVHIFVDQEK